MRCAAARNHVAEDEKSDKVTLFRHQVFTERQPVGSRAYRATQAVLFALTTA